MSVHLARIITLAVMLLGFASGIAKAADPAAGTVWTEPTTGIAFVWIPAGGFEMGCQAASCPESEKPPHRRTIAGFWLARTETTQGQWHKVMEADPSKVKKGDDYPVDQVTWEDAHAFIAALNGLGHGNFRLPTEAEWEYACRGGNSGDTYCGGSNPDVVGWFINNAKLSSHPVGQKAANAFGLFDMSGNLNEWVDDCWNETHAGAPADGRARTDGECLSRVLRGGGWGNYPAQLRATSRRGDSDVKCPYIGLRVVRDAGL
jgi:formylglycine-generating enzyme required for sulfatase activity